MAQRLFKRWWLFREPPRGGIGRRDGRWRTRTAKPLNSNSFIGTNNRFGLAVKQVGMFIFVFNTCLFRLQPMWREMQLPLHLHMVCSASFGIDSKEVSGSGSIADLECANTNKQLFPATPAARSWGSRQDSQFGRIQSSRCVYCHSHFVCD